MTPWHAFLLGVVEGLTEFLPVSSTAHLMLANRLLGQEQSSFHKTFDIAIQPGAILAVVVLYGRRLLVEWQVVKRVLLAFVPTAILGAIMYKTIKGFLENDLLALWALAVGGVVLIVFEWTWGKRHGEDEADLATMKYHQCVLIGIFQALAFVPGVSRSAATILGGQVMGLSRRSAVEFSFLLAVPTMAAATVLDLYNERANPALYENAHLLLIGFVTSFVVALVAIKLLLVYVRTRTFVPFGFYRIGVAGVLMVVFYLL